MSDHGSRIEVNQKQISSSEFSGHLRNVCQACKVGYRNSLSDQKLYCQAGDRTVCCKLILSQHTMICFLSHQLSKDRFGR
jgi:hypothetical protein